MSGLPVTSIDELKRYASADGGMDFYIALTGQGRSSKHISYDGEKFFVLNYIDESEQELSEAEIMSDEHGNIGKAIRQNAFFVFECDVADAEVESKRGWWKLEITGVDSLTDIDKEHIAKCIVEGYTEGEIIQ